MHSDYKLQEARQAFSAFLHELATPVNPSSEISRPQVRKPKIDALRYFLGRHEEYRDCADALENDCGNKTKHLDQDKWEQLTRGTNH